MTSSSSSLPVTFRDLAPEDLSDLDWSGGSTHLESLARELEGASAGNSVLLVGVLPNGRVVALGGADFRSSAQLGVLWMLVVHETLQSLGIGSRLITELEQRVRDHGARAVRLAVEHDNPRAAALYRRLGYRELGSELQSWAVTGGRTYVTVSSVLEKAL